MSEYEELAMPIWDILIDDKPHKVDRIMDVIIERCWLKDKRYLGCHEGALGKAFRDEGWRPVKELKREAK